MAKQITVTEIKKTVKGQSEATQVSATTTYQGETQDYMRVIPNFVLEKLENGAKLMNAKPGDVFTLSFDQGKFKNVIGIDVGATGGSISAAPAASVTSRGHGADSSGKKFVLTDESVRIGALQVAVAERPGKTVDVERVRALIHMIKTGEGLDVGVAEVKAAVAGPVEDLDNPF